MRQVNCPKCGKRMRVEIRRQLNGVSIKRHECRACGYTVEKVIIDG